jgi:hypothetical protein
MANGQTIGKLPLAAATREPAAQYATIPSCTLACLPGIEYVPVKW